MTFECSFTCQTIELVPRPALTIRARSSMQEIATLFDEGFREIVELLGTLGKEPLGPPFARYFNMEPDSLEVEFGFPVDEDVQGEGRVFRSTTPGGRAFTTLYIGPYAEIEPAYDALLKCVSDEQDSFSGEAYEIYIDDPSTTSPDALRTRVHLLLRDA